MPTEQPLSYTIPVGEGAAVVPYPTFPGTRILALRASGSTEAIEVPEGSPVDDFDLLMPVAAVAAPEITLTLDRVVDVCAASLAEAVGVAATALRRAVAHARQREQFGRPVGAFQAVKHRCANMHVDLEIARSLLTRLAQTGISRESRTAVTEGFERTRRVVEGCIQVHGGMGFTWETGLHLGLRHVVGLAALADHAMDGWLGGRDDVRTAARGR
ncbi:MAG: hypothetical protein GEV03_22025 [Streptosporangiales bacterium]|nr:hypothetical protein [Streptosporangiales bacterium]